MLKVLNNQNIRIEVHIMKISGIHSANQVQAASFQAPKNATREGLTGNNTTRFQSCDSIQISSHASLQVGVEAKCKEYASKWEDNISSQRLEALKSKYQGDQCPVTGKDVAIAMMERVTGKF